MKISASKFFQARCLPPLIVALLALLVHGNSFPGAFIQDDHLIVVQNPLVEQFKLVDIFRYDYWAPLSNSGLYRPLTILSLALNRYLLGADPFGFQLVNVLLHTCTALMLFCLLRAWKVEVWGAALAAALFAVHPIHAEVVNQAVGRSELLVALFLLLAFYFARREEVINSWLAAGCFVLALLSKEHAVVFAGLLPLVDTFHAKSVAIWRKRWKIYAGFGVIVSVWLAWRAWGVVRIGAPEVYDPVYVPLAYVSWLERFLTALKLQWLYLVKLVVPWPLQASYAGPDFPGVLTLTTPLTWLLLSATAVAAYVVVKGVANNRFWSLFAALFVISFLPTSNLLFPIGVTFAERLAYFPSLWFCAGFALLMISMRKRTSWQTLSVALAMFFVVGFAMVTSERNREYSSEIGLWTADVERAPANPIAWQALGESLTEKGLYFEAENAFRKALEIAPESATALNVWAVFLLKAGRYDEAISAAVKSRDLELARNDVARARGNQDLIVEALIEKGAYQQALEWLKKDESLPRGHDYRPDLSGRVLAGLGRCTEAVVAFEKIPTWQMGRGVLLGYSRCLYEAGRLSEVEALLEPLLDDPDNAAIWNFLGVARAGMGREEEALAAFRRAVAMRPQNRFYRENLERLLSQIDSVGTDR